MPTNTLETTTMSRETWDLCDGCGQPIPKDGPGPTIVLAGRAKRALALVCDIECLYQWVMREWAKAPAKVGA